MKGFGIEIKNNLLEPKHVEQMGIAVWLYMWLIDHVTAISEKGLGSVLGGKPVKFEEVSAELGISADTYTRWIDKLLEYPYIQITRTPYGIVFKVIKAHKRFRKSAVSTSAEVRNLNRKSAEPNKTVSVDSNSKTIIPSAQSAEWGLKDLNEYVKQMAGSKNRAIQIIALYLGWKGIGVNDGAIQLRTKAQAQHEIGRHLRTANRLKVYDDAQLERVMSSLSSYAKFNWTLETVEKYVNFDKVKLVDALVKIK